METNLTFDRSLWLQVHFAGPNFVHKSVHKRPTYKCYFSTDRLAAFSLKEGGKGFFVNREMIFSRQLWNSIFFLEKRDLVT